MDIRAIHTSLIALDGNTYRSTDSKPKAWKTIAGNGIAAHWSIQDQKIRLTPNQ